MKTQKQNADPGAGNSRDTAEHQATSDRPEPTPLNADQERDPAQTDDRRKTGMVIEFTEVKGLYLAELRRQWLWYRNLDIERIAKRVDLLPDETLADAGGDAALAWQAWRAGRMAELDVLGCAAIRRESA